MPIRSTLVLLLLAGGGSALANPFADQPKADDVFYHFMPIAWRDGDNDPNRFGDFTGMTDGLQYLEDLGITAVWMNPIFPSPAYHGYQHGRADEVNPWFGTEAQFLNFINQAHTRDIEVYLDLVVYGISRSSPWYQNAFGNPASIYNDWLAFTNGANTQSQGYSFNSWNGSGVGFTHWDLRTPEASDLVIGWSQKWLDPNNDGDPSDGIDGYRLDHVWVNYGNGPDGWGYNLDDFWADWHDGLRAVNPDVFTFCEQHDWGSHGAEFLPEFSAAMTKPFEFAARDAVRDANAGALYGQMQSTVNAFVGASGSDAGTFVGIIGDHDVDRLASVIGADTPGTIDRAKAAAAVLMLQPFPPIIYYGDEIAMVGTKQDYGSDANDIPFREPFKWNATEGTPMTRYHLLNGPASNTFSADNDGRSVEEQWNDGVLKTYRDLIALRHDHVALRRGDYDPIGADRGDVWAFMRSYEAGEAPIADGTQFIGVAINLSASSVSVDLDLGGFVQPGDAFIPTDLATGNALPLIDGANADAYPVTIPAYGHVLIEGPFKRPPAPRFAIDGQLDEGYTEVATNGAQSLWAAMDGDTLYVATQPASNGADRFIFTSDNTAGVENAPWAKSGVVATYDAFIGNEADNGFAGWFDHSGGLTPVQGTVLEGAINLRTQYGTLPTTLYLAAASFGNDNGDPLLPALQVPGGNGNTTLEASEYVEVDIESLRPIDEPACAADFDGNGEVNLGDFGVFGAAFGSSTGDANYNPEADFDSNGEVNLGDFGVFGSEFGRSDC